MAFAVVCKSCQARFLLNDDLLRRRVAGKVVTVRCRQCHAAIEVDASDVDPKTLPETFKPAPPPLPKPVHAVKSMTPKPAPAPPRPVKSSTLMGIGGPPRPAGATEMVALSPGFLSVSAAPTKATVHGFPEPPPPPGVIEELSSGDWDIPESSPSEQLAAAPESLDDFVEELPPSLPPPEEDPLPSSSGTPSLKALTHHDEHAAKPRVDDFFANMSAAMNGGVMPDAVGGAPTIDVSAFTTATAEPGAAEVMPIDVPLSGGKTLPLFALGSEQAALLGAAAEPAPASKPAAPSSGSLTPATLSEPSSKRPDSGRERKNVVAPATKSVPPAAAGRRRSGLAAPVLLALAATAGFLIWKRSATTSSTPTAERPAAAVVERGPEPVAVTVAATQPAETTPAAALASVAGAPTPPTDDVTFETAKAQPAAHDKTNVGATTPAPPTAPATPAAAITTKPAEPSTTASPAAAKPEPPVAKEEPAPAAEPAPPAEPAGPFDRAAAAAALTSAASQASACRKEGDPSGVAAVVITFAPSGRVTSANVSGPPFAGTPTGGCIAAALRKARVPAFDGDRVTVSKTITVQ